FNDEERTVFYQKTDGQVPYTKVDFVELALHELLHAVGFSVQMNVTTGQLYKEGTQEFWDRYSLFVVDEGLVHLTAVLPAERRVLLEFGTLWWDGDYVKEANQNRSGSAILPGGQGKLHTPYPPTIGATLTHWDGSFSNPEEIMEPDQPYEQALRDIGLARPLLRDMGWGLRGGTVVPQDLDFYTQPTTGPKAADTLPFFIVGGEADGLDVSAITIEGEHAAEFSHDNFGWSGTVELYERRVVNVTFDPTSAGYKRARIRVSFENVGIPDVLVLLQGYGIGQDTDGDGISDIDETRDLDDDSPGTQNPFNSANNDSTGNNFDPNPNGFPDGGDDWDHDGMSNERELVFGYSVIDPLSVGVMTTTDTDGDGLDDVDETTDIDLTIPGLQLPFDPYWMDSAGDSGQTSPDGTRDGDNDWDGDGIPNGIEGASDADGDGLANLNDTDADGDGIPDVVETAGDQDGDGTPDYLDTDTDNDGIGDAEEGQGDPDSDGIPNFRDIDSDGDGYSDQVENWLGTDPYDPGDFPANLPVFPVPVFSE
ncbi:MAG: MSCRAMM family adhesin SdrC, partial [Candidatus Hydrogenedentes bacterium]|nr:MSCRAMM family adhesin SdrC [Candidatus Hydrogenedentota bacterium]